MMGRGGGREKGDRADQEDYADRQRDEKGVIGAKRACMHERVRRSRSQTSRERGRGNRREETSAEHDPSDADFVEDVGVSPE